MSETDQQGELPKDATPDPAADGDSSALLRALQSRSDSGRERRGLLPDSQTAGPGERVGHYELGPEIARGGIGLVLRGRDLDLGREVALKVLRPECADSAVMIERFVEEAQIGGQLQHPGIVPVYDLGVQADQRPYFAMKLIEGRTLAELMAERSDPSQDARRFLSIFERICETVAYAHARGVVHRDLKPANVMVGAFGEVQVVDWGLAKVLGSERGDARDAAGDEGAGSAKEAGQASVAQPAAHESSSRAPQVTTIRTQTDQDSSASIAGSVLGTPAYMPPEQARGDHASVLETADVFALGAILMEILTDKGPYADAVSALGAAADAETGPALERLRASDAGEALIELCTRCLSLAPEDRPANASVLAQEVAQYLAAAEEHAQQARIKAAEERRARRFTVVLASVVGVVILIGAAVSWQLQSARSERLSRTQAAVAEALDKVARHRVRSGSNHELEAWGATFAAFQLARTAAESGESDAELHRRLNQLQSELEQERATSEIIRATMLRDQQLLDRLAATRELSDPRMMELDHRENWFREAFLEYGLDFANTPLDPLCAAVSDSPIGVDLACGLDDWARYRRIQAMDPATRGRFPEPSVETLLIVAQAADPEELRNELRDAVLEGPAALMDYSRAADLDALPPDVLSLLATWLSTSFSTSTRAEALRVLERGVQLHPGDFRMQYQLAESRAAAPARDWAGALPHFRMAHALQPGDLQLRSKLATALLTTQHFAEARTLAEATLVMAPGYARAHGLRGLALAGEGRLEKSVEPLRLGLATHPEPEIRLQLADILNALGRSQEAEADYLHLVEQDRAYTTARLRYARMLVLIGRAEDGLAQMQQADRFAPTNFDAVAGHAQALLNLQRYEDAARVYRRALLLDPGKYSASIGLSYCLMRSGQQEQALQEAELTARQNKDQPKVLAGAMLSLFYVDEIDRAIELGEQSLTRFVQDPVLLSWTAYLWLFRGDGGADSGRALQLARDAAEAAESLADGTPQGEAAREDLLQNHPYLYATLGAAWMREGDPAMALRAFERRALPLGSFQSSTFLLLQAMAHADCEEPEQARACYDDAVRWAEDFEQLFGSLEMQDVLPEYRRTRVEAQERLGVD